jgi:hypothetical protein
VADRSAAIKAQVKGFLNPIFVERDPRTGEVLASGLAPDDFQMVAQGFACARCLAIFDTYTITCPACLLQRDFSADVPQAPELWLAHLREQQQEEPTPREPRSFDEAMAAKLAAADVDTIPLSKMRKRRRR